MSFLIDTNIISEVRKGDRCDPTVAAWWSGVAEDDLWLSALVLGEIRKGVELARRRDPTKAAALEAWLGDVIAGFGDRVLPVDTAVAEEWGRMNAIRPVPVIDFGTNGIMAATGYCRTRRVRPARRCARSSTTTPHTGAAERDQVGRQIVPREAERDDVVHLKGSGVSAAGAARRLLEGGPADRFPARAAPADARRPEQMALVAGPRAESPAGIRAIGPDRPGDAKRAAASRAGPFDQLRGATASVLAAVSCARVMQVPVDDRSALAGWTPAWRGPPASGWTPVSAGYPPRAAG
ncbi:MAG: type II toxin-antitoxin system VapC family toxin [Rhodobacterales bacterium]|nr:type II toxin-antitoxin system VapC family toxin [Rhodobacterales bacterium]